MTTWIALFRAINVGGRNVISMKDLTADLEQLRLSGIRTYIQSGNVAFESSRRSADSLRSAIRKHILGQRGFEPELIVLRRDELQQAVTENPFPEAAQEPSTLHYFFLDQPAGDADLEALKLAAAPSERHSLTPRVFYLHAPEGVGRSKLARNAERHLGVPTTARNHRTVTKLLQLTAPDD